MTDVLPLLTVPSDPRFFVWEVASPSDAGTMMFGWREARLVVRTVRGRKMRTPSQLDDEFSAALQFPSYFGENWAAFDECVKDLEWLPPDAGYVIVVTDPLLVLDGSPTDFEVFVRILSSAIEHWATPIQAGEWWDRPAVPLNVVLTTDPGSGRSVRERWVGAGAVLSDLV